MNTKLKNKISPIYRGVVNESLLEMPIPEEKFANCLDCHSCVHKKSPRAITKCCDYHPYIPNYVIGAILSDDRPELAEGRKRITERIHSQVGVIPYGILPSTVHSELFKESRKTKGWPSRMKVEELLCPYNDKGLCTVWDYRSELCATFHCNSVSGQSGKIFWQIFFQYLTEAERSLTLYIMDKMDYPIHLMNTKRITPDTYKLDDEKGQVDQKKYKNLWDRWQGAEIEFYQSCFRIFTEIDPATYLRLVGQDGALLEEKLRFQQMRFIKNITPDFLKFKSEDFPATKINENTVALGGMKISYIHYQVLKLFDGQTPSYDVVRKSLIMRQPISNLIRPLMKAGILVAVSN